MERLDRLSSYFNEKERKRLNAKAQQNHDGLPEMTFDEIKLSCLENNGYETPELNDKLYLHFRGFKKIENLDKFTGCKSIWLDSNGFSKIENLEPMQELRCLYLSKNLIGSINGLASLQHLTILDLSYNRLTHIDNLSSLPMLQTVNVSHNFLATPDAIKHFQLCSTVNNIDLTNNRLEESDQFYDVFRDVPSLVALSVNGNDITKQQGFRKRMLASMPKLGYLDRPVDVQERRFAIAFVSGGAEAESAERAAWRKEQEEDRINKMNEFKNWQEEQRRERATALAEGRSLITEFTPAEQAQREEEAQAASDAEKRLLDLGIGKLANEYWKMEGKVAPGVDPLDAAAEKLLAAQESNNSATATAEEASEAVVDVSEIALDVDEEDQRIVEIGEGDTHASSPSKSDGTVDSADADADTGANADAGEVFAPEAEAESPCTAAEESKADGPTAAKSIDNEEEQEQKQLRRKEMEEQQLREERVAESFYIYKKQLEAQSKQSGRSGGGNSNTVAPFAVPGAAAGVPANTWDAPFRTGPAAQTDDDNDESRPLFWSEDMDIKLAKLVKTCMFDFEEISVKMQALAGSSLLSNAAVHRRPQRLTSEVCRLRWAHLDAAQWSEVHPDTSALDTEFKVCINAELLGAGHGAQPSFEALSSMTAGCLPAYLKPPKSFPTVADMDGDSDLDLD